MPVPQALEDLPYAAYLERFSGDLTREGDYTELLFADTEFGQHARMAPVSREPGDQRSHRPAARSG
jgi:hypothetical protein